MILGLQKRSRPWPWVTWLTWLTSWLTSCVVLSSAFTPSTDRCGIAQSRCVQNPACLPILRRYLTYCSDLIDGPPLSSTTCWPRCRRTLPLLLHIPDGRAFVGCDCQLNAHCLEQRQRLQSCGFGSSSASSSSSSSVNPLRPVGREHSEATTTTCIEARKSCVSDKVCQDALTIANVVCAGVERKGRCDRPCRNSLRTLYSVNHGRQLRSCRCDDLDPDPDKCSSALRQRTKTLCQKRRSKQGLPTGHGPTTITPSMSTHHPQHIPTPHRHLLNASIDFRMFQRSGSDAIRTGSLVTAGTLRTASGSTAVARPADRNARTRVPYVTSHVEEVEIKMAAASSSAMKWISHWNRFYSLACWILLLSVMLDDWTQ